MATPGINPVAGQGMQTGKALTPFIAPWKGQPGTKPGTVPNGGRPVGDPVGVDSGAGKGIQIINPGGSGAGSGTSYPTDPTQGMFYLANLFGQLMSQSAAASDRNSAGVVVPVGQESSSSGRGVIALFVIAAGIGGFLWWKHHREKGGDK